jgi:UDP-N-acetyl-D-mannosaminuronic acid transferase (WecB/TagA/CpsF family)
MTSMAPELFAYAAGHGKTVYIVASKQEQVEKAVEIFRERIRVGCGRRNYDRHVEHHTGFR